MNQFPSEAQVARIRQNYPIGTRILLNHMDDKWAVPSGTRGTVVYVDDAGQLGMKWDNGRSLALIPGVDNFRKLTEQELLKEQNANMTMEEQSL